MTVSGLQKAQFVLDCSLAMAWCFEDEISPYSEKILTAVSEINAIVPLIWSVEVANVLAVAERKKRLTHIQAISFQESLNMLLIQVDDHLLQKPIATIHQLTRETGLTAYDATYLELALRKNLPLATLDKELKKAAQRMKVELYSY